VARTAPPDVALDGDAGSDAVARALRDAGFEVIYGPPPAGADELAEAVLQEDADAVVLAADGVVALSGALASRGLEDVLVIAIEGGGADVVARIGRGLGVDGDS
jgi:methylmalonyl-CoA mutase cobalamin-binding domain/chain